MKQEPKRRYETGIPLRPASIEEAGLFYSQVDADEDFSFGTVGHIRVDFGHGRKEFWHTWWPHNDDQFNTQEFKADLQTIVDALRTEGPLRDLATMRTFCNQNGGKITDDGRSFGYVVDTEHYRYLRPASDDFQEIVKFHINEVGVQSARKIYGTMRDAINKLADFPLMGQIHPDPMLAADNYRKLVLTRTYVAIYKVENGIVYLYRIVNGATDYPKLLK